MFNRLVLVFPFCLLAALLSAPVVRVVLAVCGFFLPIAFLRAQETARAVIEKAIEAQGGETQVAKLRIMRIKVELKMDLGPDQKDVPVILEDTWQMPDNYKTVSRFKVSGETLTHTMVIDGEKGWEQVNAQVMDLPKSRLVEFREQKHGEDLDRLAFLKEKGHELSLLEEIKIHGKPAVGALIKSKGHRDVKLYFDKSSGLLVKRERQIGGDAGKEVLQEVFFSDYQEQDGLKHYRKISGFHDGKKFAEGTVTEVEFFDKLDPKVFAKP